jgi:hypothetical protein
VKVIRKVLIALLLLIFFADLGTVLFLNVSYSSHLPQDSDEKAGRIYRMNVNHGFVVYGTKQEFQRLNLTEKFLPLAAICGLIAGILNFKYGDFPPLKPVYPRKF